MKNQAKINGKDIWDTWGATLLRGSYEKLLTPPSMKEYIENESRLEHGKRINTTNAKVSSREFSLQFFIEGSSESEYLSRFQSFIQELEKGAVSLYVERLKKTYELVYTECSSYGDYGLKKGKLAVKFVEPNPKK